MQPDFRGASPRRPPAGASAYTVIRRYQLLPDASMEDLVKRVNAGFMPIVSRIAGFQEYPFVDAGDSAHLTISLYDDPSGAEQSTRNVASCAAEDVAALIEGPPEVTAGWVRSTSTRMTSRWAHQRRKGMTCRAAALTSRRSAPRDIQRLRRS